MIDTVKMDLRVSLQTMVSKKKDYELLKYAVVKRTDTTSDIDMQVQCQ